MNSASADSGSRHEPVMPGEVLEILNPLPQSIALDCTMGYGGHSAKILERLSAQGRLIGMDRDMTAVNYCREKFKGEGSRVQVFHANFREMKTVCNEAGVSGVDSILMDCGVSSLQLDMPERGFSFLEEGPLDMRMDQDRNFSLAQFLKSTDETELADTIYAYGEERYSRRISRAIMNALRNDEIQTTTDLAQVIYGAVPSGYRHGRIHPATRTFQALRIRVNDELNALEKGLEQGMQLLNPGGRMAVIAFHSLEDGIVKRFFRQKFQDGAGEILTKKPLVPGDEEMQANPRSRSAKLRGFRKAS